MVADKLGRKVIVCGEGDKGMRGDGAALDDVRLCRGGAGGGVADGDEVMVVRRWMVMRGAGVRGCRGGVCWCGVTGVPRMEKQR